VWANNSVLSAVTEVESVLFFVDDDSFNAHRTNQAIALGLNALEETRTRQKPELLTC